MDSMSILAVYNNSSLSLRTALGGKQLKACEEVASDLMSHVVSYTWVSGFL